MTSFAASAEPAAALQVPGRPGVLRLVAEIGALTGVAFRAARAYDHAGTPAARLRVLDEFAAGTHRAA